MSRLGIQHVPSEYLYVPPWSPPPSTPPPPPPPPPPQQTHSANLKNVQPLNPAARVSQDAVPSPWRSARRISRYEEERGTREEAHLFFSVGKCVPSPRRQHICRLIRQMRVVWGNSFPGTSNVNTDSWCLPACLPHYGQAQLADDGRPAKRHTECGLNRFQDDKTGNIMHTYNVAKT